jgi:hypothetical protein
MVAREETALSSAKLTPKIRYCRCRYTGNPPPDSIEFRHGKSCLLSSNFRIGHNPLGTRDVDGVSVHINLFPQRAADGPYWGRHSIPLTDA